MRIPDLMRRQNRLAEKIKRLQRLLVNLNRKIERNKVRGISYRAKRRDDNGIL